MTRVRDRLISLFVPPVCLICRRGCEPGERICPLCRRQLDSVPLGTLRRREGLESIASAFPHEGAARALVAELKFNGAVAVARPMAELMLERCGASLRCCDWLVPAPPHPQRLRARGYNQSLLIARELSRLVDVPVVDCLVRRAGGRPQSELGRSERLAMSPRSVLVAANSPPPEARVVLCDDVVTTATTLVACAQALARSAEGRRSGHVRAVTFASR